MNIYKHINLEYINEMASGDKEFIIEMINDYKDKMPEYIKELNEAMTSMNLEDLKFHSHKLSSSFLIMGARELADSAARIVKDVKEGNQDNTDQLLNEVNSINRLFKYVVAELDEELLALTKGA